ncbi:MAG: hypothetical protein V1798_12230 [Pseudomonadota bacterium]
MKSSCWILFLFAVVAPLSPALAQAPRVNMPAAEKNARVDVTAVADRVRAFSTVFSAVTVRSRGNQDPETFKAKILASYWNCAFSEPNTDPATVDSILANTDRDAFDELQTSLRGIEIKEKAYQAALPGRRWKWNLCSPNFRRVVYILPHTAIEIVWYDEERAESRRIEDVVEKIRASSHGFDQVDLVKIGTGKFNTVEDLFDKRYWDCGFNIESTDSAKVDGTLEKTDRHAFRVLQKELKGLSVQERVLGYGKPWQRNPLKPLQDICGTGNRLLAYILPEGKAIVFHWYASERKAPTSVKHAAKPDSSLQEQSVLLP